MIASYDHRLVLLSIVVSVLAAYASRELFGRIIAAHGWVRIAWLVGGATVDGIGTWSMHYTGMLALQLPVALLFDWPTVLLSLFVSIIGSGGALVIVTRRHLGWARAVATSLVLGGVGISGLHFTAMSAIRFPEVHHTNHLLVASSILVAIIISLLAIAVAFMFAGDVRSRRLQYHGGAWLRGLANPAMHYTAMAAVIFTYSTSAVELSHTVSISSLGILGISVVPVMLLVVLLLTALVDRLREYEKVVEGLEEMIVVVDRDYRYLLANSAFLKYRGLQREQVLGRMVSEVLNPGVFEGGVREKLDQCFAGNVVRYEMNYNYPELGERNLSLSYFPIERPSGIDRAVCILHDITESKLAEEQLKAYSAQLRAFSARLESAREEEGKRIAREIHDELGSALSGLRWELEEVDEVISETKDLAQLTALRAKIAGMITLTNRTLSAVRRIAAELRPFVLDELGLIEAIEWQAEQFQARTGIVCHCECALESIELNQKQATAIFRIFQEALTNILRHAEATRVEITMKKEAGEFVLSISDNGRGIKEEEKSESLGLLGMRERTDMIGGKLEVSGIIEKGTTITLRVPISSAS
jgi:PAS domain S-box-containing protein